MRRPQASGRNAYRGGAGQAVTSGKPQEWRASIAAEDCSRACCYGPQGREWKAVQPTHHQGHGRWAGTQGEWAGRGIGTTGWWSPRIFRHMKCESMTRENSTTRQRLTQSVVATSTSEAQLPGSASHCRRYVHTGRVCGRCVHSSCAKGRRPARSTACTDNPHTLPLLADHQLNPSHRHR